MESKIFVGSANEKVFADGGKVLKISFNYDDLQKLLSNLSSKGYVNLNVNRTNKQGAKNTHYMSIDTWQPAQQGQFPQKHQENKNWTNIAPKKEEEERFSAPNEEIPF